MKRVNWTKARVLRRAARRLIEAEPPLWVERTELGRKIDNLPEAISQGDIAGLLTAQAFYDEESDSTSLLTIWKSAAIARLNRGRVASELGAVFPVWSGAHHHLWTPRVPWWALWKRPQALWNIVVAAFALFGFFEALLRYHAELLAAPEVHLEVEAAERTVVGNPVEITVNATNVARAGKVDLSYRHLRMRNMDGGQVHHVNSARFVSRYGIEPGKTTTIPLELTPEAPGRFDLEFAGQAESGHLRSARVFQTSTTFEVWPIVEVLTPEFSLQGSSSCWVSFPFRSGRAFSKGLRFEASARLAGVRVERLWARQGSTPPKLISTARAFKASWLTEPLGAFQEFDVAFLLASEQPKTLEEWKVLGNRGKPDSMGIRVIGEKVNYRW